MEIDEEMDGNASGEESFDLAWTTDEDDEIQKEIEAPSSVTVRRPGDEIMAANGEPSSSSTVSHSMLVKGFVEMEFPEALVTKVIGGNGEGDPSKILDVLLSHREEDYAHFTDGSPLQHSSEPQPQQNVSSDLSLSDNTEDLLGDGWSEDEIIEEPSSATSERLLSVANTGTSSENEQKLLFLSEMGFTIEEGSIAMERCGPDAPIDELADFIVSAQTAREYDFYLPEDNPMRRHSNGTITNKKRKRIEEENSIRLPNPMIGYGVPSMQSEHIRRPIPDGVQGPPFFYFENVALAPKGVWDTISRHLYEIEPEFVDSKYFCATARKRGYVHNLPIENRFPLIPLPPMTISQAFPLSTKYWPKWDPRDKLNCILTSLASANPTKEIRESLERYNDEEPPDNVKKEVLEKCRRWNLIWTGKSKVATLEPDEMETLLGFPKNHTRGGGISRTERLKSLGSSFQVDTVAYHLSVLKDIFPNGMNVLSLFSGIGGAEVALHRLGIKLNNVFSVEKSRVNRDILSSWWEQTNQKGQLKHYNDVEQVDDATLEEIISSASHIDLVIGGSPCTNLSGGNRVSRDGLEGSESALFFEFVRVLNAVKSIMAARASPM